MVTRPDRACRTFGNISEAHPNNCDKGRNWKAARHNDSSRLFAHGRRNKSQCSPSRRGSVVQHISSSMRFIQEWKRQESERPGQLGTASGLYGLLSVIRTTDKFGEEVASEEEAARPPRVWNVHEETRNRPPFLVNACVITRDREGTKRPEMRAQYCMAILSRKVARGDSCGRFSGHSKVELRVEDCF